MEVIGILLVVWLFFKVVKALVGGFFDTDYSRDR